MKIAIDTRQDSVEELKHAIELLSRIVSKRDSYSAAVSEEPQHEVFNNEEQPRKAAELQPGIFDLFKESNEQAPGYTVVEESSGAAQDEAVLMREDFSIFAPEEEKKDNAKVQMYF